MFQALQQFQRIVVSGPHRSGTTICARMVAADTGYDYADESHFGWSNWELFSHHLQREHIVLQAPFLADRLHQLHEIVDPNSYCVIFMRRPIEEINRSQAEITQRFGQRNEGIRLFRLQRLHSRSAAPDVVYEHWESARSRIRHWREIEYASLRVHPLWLEDRSHFTSFRQTA